MDTTPDTPVADQLAKARADLDKATTAVKLANAKRARLAAEVRALEAEAEIEAMRIQARADRERAEEAERRAAEDALEQERRVHLKEERAHAAEIERLKRPASKRANGRKDDGAPGHAPIAEPGNRSGAAATLAIVPDAGPPE